MTDQHSINDSLFSAFIGPGTAGTSNWPAISQALKEGRLKNEEKEKIGDMLVEFFESELAVDDLIATAIRLRQDLFENAKGTLLPFIPARRKMDFLEKNSIVMKKTAARFNKLHDDRNKLAHPQGRDKRPGKVFTNDIRKQFIKDCHTVLSECYKAHLKMYKQEETRHAEINRKAFIQGLAS